MKRPFLCCLFVLLAAACSDDSSDGGGGGGTATGGSDAGSSTGGGGSSGRGGSVGTGGRAQTGGSDGGTAGAGDGSAGALDAGDAGDSASDIDWVGTWVAAPQKNESHNLPPTNEDAGVSSLKGTTLRQALRVSIGGTKLRLKLSNEYGNGNVTMDSVRLAAYKGNGTIDTSTDTVVKFGGSTSVTIPAGKAVTSDTFNYALNPLTEQAITMHFTEVPTDITGHPGSRTTSYVQLGDVVSAASFTDPLTKQNWYYIMGIDVMADKDTAAVVVLGDSIPDGRGSTPDSNNRWPDIIANRLKDNAATAKVAMLNQSIGGNRVVLDGGLGPTGKARFQHDVLDQSGVKWLIVAEGVNDIGGAAADMDTDGGADAGEGGVDGSPDVAVTSSGPTASQVATLLIDTYKDFIAKAHQKGIKAYGVPIATIGETQYYVTTVAPDAGADTLAALAASPYREAARVRVNKWMTDNVGKADGFDAVMDLADPITNKTTTPPCMLGEYWNFDSDRLHPNANGHKKMGEAADLSLFILKP